MRHLTKDPNCYLVELSDLDGRLPEPANAFQPALSQTVAWARSYLCRPHPDLGREGPVCPFVQASMDKGLFFLTVCPGGEIEEDGIREILVRYRDWFSEIEPRSGGDAIFKTILVLFPDLPLTEVPRLIEGTQENLRDEYVAKGLMIGEFHAGPPNKAGLWNPDFRPLRSPMPMLVIRHMVPTDFVFLKDRRELVAAYLQVHGNAVPVHIKEQVRQVVGRFGLSWEEPPLHPRVRAALHRAGVAYKIHRHAEQPFPIQGPADFARALGYPLERITKSLFLRCRCHGKYLVVVCPVEREPSLPRLAHLVGCKQLELASAEELAIVLGYPAQGVPPMAVDSMQVLMDEDLLAHPTVLTAAGEIEVEVEIAPGDLRRLTRALLYSPHMWRERKESVARYASGSGA